MIAHQDTMRFRPFSALVPTAETGQWTDHGRALYAVRLLAARMMLASWTERFPAFTHAVLVAGVVGLRQGPHPTRPSWPLNALEVPSLIVASVAMGVEYASWPGAWRMAMRESGAASPRCAGCNTEAVPRSHGGFDDYPEHITHACPACGNGWTETGAE